MDRSTHTPQSWIEAGFRALTRGGPSAIKVEAIAREMGVSKGSFYWHFSGVPALRTAMLELWRKVATDQIIITVDAASDDPMARLRTLMEMAAQAPSDAYGGAGTEAAIRDWARFDPEAAQVLAVVDAARMAYLTKLMSATGTTAAKQKARLVYACLIGLQAMPDATDTTRQADLTELTEQLIAR